MLVVEADSNNNESLCFEVKFEPIFFFFVLTTGWNHTSHMECPLNN